VFGHQTSDQPDLVCRDASPLYDHALCHGQYNRTLCGSSPEKNPSSFYSVEFGEGINYILTSMIVPRWGVPEQLRHLYETAEELGIPQKERAGWVNPRLKAISNGEVGRIREELKDEYADCHNHRLKRLIGYIDRFGDALNYNEFKEKGYPLGSGEVESAHKYVPQKRLKLPGACWHPDSINPMVALRVLRANSWWDDFWNKRAENKIAA
jgi:hypothetical protein